MDIGTQVATGAFISFLIQQLKKAESLPWINAQSAKINRALAIVGSGIGTLGIHIACSNVTHSCQLTWISGTAILLGLKDWAVQFAVTHGWYKATSGNGQ